MLKSIGENLAEKQGLAGGTPAKTIPKNFRKSLPWWVLIKFCPVPHFMRGLFDGQSKSWGSRNVWDR
jgi:hypothetical protein